MTDNEIIKALECCTSDKCTCSECSYEYKKNIKNEEFEVMSNGKSYDEWSCDEWLKCDLLDLINRQKAEIEKLTKLNDILLEAGQRWQKRYEILVKELTEGKTDE